MQRLAAPRPLQPNTLPARAVLAAIAAAIAVPALAPAGAREAFERYTDPQYGYSVGVPPGWTRKADMARPYVAFVGPIVNDFQANVNIYTEPAAHKTLAQYVKVSKEAIAKDKEMRLQLARPGRLGGAPAELLQYAVAVKGHPPAVVRQVVAVRGGRGYQVTFTAPPKELKSYLPTFDRVLASFKFDTPAAAGRAGTGK
jgi:hypothetical protein